MRGLYSSKTEIRHKIFTEIARMAYEGKSPETLEELPYKIVPGEISVIGILCHGNFAQNIIVK